jgi:tetratricopeptide (TPR) repeat protein
MVGMDLTDNLNNRRVALVGRFGGMTQREATNVLRTYNASVVELDAENIDWVVVGAEESPLAEADLLGSKIHDAAADGDLEILHETELWQRLGLVDIEHSARRYYTPAMLAHLLDVPVSVIRRWHRRGLIQPVRTLHKLPYFDFQEVATARRMAHWIASGDSPKVIEQRLVDLVEVLPDIQRPLDQLSILIEGKHVLLRRGAGLLEPGGQMRFDFDVLDGDEEPGTPSILSIDAGTISSNRAAESAADPLLSDAYAAEDAEHLETAVDLYHAILARDGPRPEINFQIAELLYRMGYIIAARERYYTAIELDPEFVEARSSLGCVLAELGQTDLAIAAFRGALMLHDGYSEVHYHLAAVLEADDRHVEAQHHWKRFVDLAPESPWANDALDRIRAIEDLL